MKPLHPTAGVLALLLAVSACHRDSPTSAGPPTEITEPGPISAPPEVVAPYIVLLGDVTSRLLPGLIDQEVAAGLGAHLDKLRSAMVQNNGTAARASWNSAMKMVTDYRDASQPGARDAADVVGIMLNLSVADQLIGASQ